MTADRPVVSFHFDLSCPFAYLASTAVEACAARAGADLHVRPFLLGGVFRARNVAQNLASTLSPSKAAHNLRDMIRGAEQFGVPFAMPAGHPLRTVTALRVLLAHNRAITAREPDPGAHGRAMLPLMHRLFEAYWVRGIDISSRAGLTAVLSEAGLDPEGLLAQAETTSIKEELRARTDEAIELGIFGAPAMIVRGRGPFGEDPEGPHLFWGQDRLPFVERALGGTPPEPTPRTDGPPVQVWFDFSSPFAYLGVSRARRFLGDRIVWRPMLLGAVFKTLGGPDVPLHSYNAAKQAWIASDLRWQAREAGVPLVWPSRFPLRTVLPLRVTLLALAGGPASRAEELIHRIFEAVWVKDRDPADPDVVKACCDEVGLDGADLLRRAGEPAARHGLFAATEAAVDAGVFGAPTYIVDPDGQTPELFWGNDRLPQVVAATSRDPAL
jgi:2-hydroxychromene-2-carboxylate isomerase